MVDDLESKINKEVITEYIEICMSQWIRPKYYFEKDGYGDCRICTTDYKNKYCKGYYPIKLRSVKVSKDE